MTPDNAPRPPKGLGPLAKREMRFAYMLLLPTFLIVLSVVLFPLFANVWISFKPVTLGDLRAPSILVNERLMGDVEAVGDEADIRYRIRNSSRKSDIADVSMSDTLPATLEIISIDDRCSLDGQTLLCDLGNYEAGKREDVIVQVAATQAFIDDPINVKDTDAVFEFVPENILTNNDFTLENFRKVFNASDFWQVLWASLYYTIAGTVGALVMGLFAAQLMNITFRGRSFLRGLYLSPYVAPVIAVALAWVLLLDPGPGGTLNALLLQLGVIDGPISFLGQRVAEINFLGLTFNFPVALTVVIIFEIWRYFPLAMLFILARMQSIELILSDVDGVMTDGGITYDNQGIETKTFHVRDGMGIKLWQKTGHRFGVITARSSHIVKLRMDELGVDFIRQGTDQKRLLYRRRSHGRGFDEIGRTVSIGRRRG